MDHFIRNKEIKISVIILSMQLAIWGALLSDIRTPLISEILGIIFLTFMPGFLLLKIIWPYKLDNIDGLLFSVALSIFILMFSGLFVNSIGPLLRISHPISLYPILIFLSLLLLILSFILYKLKRNTFILNLTEIKDFFSYKYILIYILFPIFSALSVNFMNTQKNNAFLIILITMIAISPFIIISFSPRKLYPYIIIFVSLALLYHKSLISPYIFGSDTFGEYKISLLVLSKGYWDLNTPDVLNGMLSIAMLGPIYSMVTKLDLIWVYKLIYPLIFCMVPLGLFRLVQKQTNDEIAIISAFLLMFTSSFYGILLEAQRQQIAELFLILSIYTLINKDINPLQKRILVIILVISLTVSHYGTSYIYLIILLEFATVTKFFSILDNKYAKRVRSSFFSEDPSISLGYVIIFLVFALSWYMNISQSIAFVNFVHLFRRIMNDMGFLLDPDKVEALNTIVASLSFSRQITKYFYLFTQASISLGFCLCIFNKYYVKFRDEFLNFALIYLIFLASSIAVPDSSAAMTTPRVYHNALLILSPFFVLGFSSIMIKIRDMLSRSKQSNQQQIVDSRTIFKLLAIFLGLFLLFDSGLICEVLKETPPNSLALNNSVVIPRHYSEQEVNGGLWLSDKIKPESKISADRYCYYIFSDLLGLNETIIIFQDDTIKLPSNTFIFVGALNLKEDEILSSHFVRGGLWKVGFSSFRDSKFYKNNIHKSSKIFFNGYAQINSNI